MKLTDLLVERTKLLKNMMLWKVAFAIACALLIALYFKDNIKNVGSNNPQNNQKEIIGIIDINPTIKDFEKFHSMLDDIKDNDSIKALIINIDSPGGNTGVFEKIYHKIEAIKSKKPVVAVMESVAASGGYLVALPTDRIYALNMTITGSIGVLSMYPELIGVAEKLGVKFIQLKSNPLKASPNPFEELTEAAKEARMQTIMDSYNYFVEIVAKNRNLSIEEVKQFADGRIFTGRQALNYKMIDEIGTTDNAVEWLKKDKKIASDAVVKSIKPKKKNEFLEAIVNNLENSSQVFVDQLWNKLISAKYETQ